MSRRFDTASYEAFADGYFLTMASMRSFWQLYVGDDAPRYADLYAAGDLAGLPPATVFSCGLDPLRDEGEEYADRLARAGVPTTLIRTYGLIHGAWIMDATVRRALPVRPRRRPRVAARRIEPAQPPETAATMENLMLTATQLTEYSTQGFCVVPGRCSASARSRRSATRPGATSQAPTARS